MSMGSLRALGQVGYATATGVGRQLVGAQQKQRGSGWSGQEMGPSMRPRSGASAVLGVDVHHLQNANKRGITLALM